MEALTVLLRFPFYSIGKRSFQVRTSLLLPPPSTLKGALAKGVILLKGIKGDTLDEIAEATIKELEKKLIYVGAKPYRSVIVKSPVLLKRLRNLEDPKKPEKSDAMRREYTFVREILAVYVFKGITAEEKALYQKAAYLIDQLGDTESLGSVINAEFIEIQEKAAPIRLYVPVKSLRVSGYFLVENMFENSDFGKKVKEIPYYLPLEEVRYRRAVYYREIDPGIEVNKSIEAFREVVGLWIPEISS